MLWRLSFILSFQVCPQGWLFADRKCTTTALNFWQILHSKYIFGALAQCCPAILLLLGRRSGPAQSFSYQHQSDEPLFKRILLQLFELLMPVPHDLDGSRTVELASMVCCPIYVLSKKPSVALGAKITSDQISQIGRQCGLPNKKRNSRGQSEPVFPMFESKILPFEWGRLISHSGFTGRSLVLRLCGW